MNSTGERSTIHDAIPHTLDVFFYLFFFYNRQELARVSDRKLRFLMRSFLIFKKVRKKFNHFFTDSLDSGGALLAQRAACRWPVSMFHTETSLLPCDVDINHDDSVGCGIIFRIRVADGC